MDDRLKRLAADMQDKTGACPHVLYGWQACPYARHTAHCSFRNVPCWLQYIKEVAR